MLIVSLFASWLLAEGIRSESSLLEKTNRTLRMDSPDDVICPQKRGDTYEPLPSDVQRCSCTIPESLKAEVVSYYETNPADKSGDAIWNTYSYIGKNCQLDNEEGYLSRTGVKSGIFCDPCRVEHYVKMDQGNDDVEPLYCNQQTGGECLSGTNPKKQFKCNPNPESNANGGWIVQSGVGCGAPPECPARSKGAEEEVLAARAEAEATREAAMEGKPGYAERPTKEKLPGKSAESTED